MKPAWHNTNRVPVALTAMLVIAALYFARELLIPLALAVFLTFLLFPVVRALERLRMRRAMATGLAVAGSVAAVAAGAWLMLAQGAELIEKYPQYKENILSKVREVQRARHNTMSVAKQAVDDIIVEIARPVTTAPASAAAGDANHPALPAATPDAAAAGGGDSGAPPDEAPAEEEAEPVRVEIVPPRQALVEATFVRLFGPVMSPLATIGIALIFVVFFLIYMEDLHARALRVLGQAGIDIPPTALVDAGSRVMRYVSTLGLANAISGCGIAAGLFVIGLPNYLLWGLLAAILRFIPVIGTWISIVFPTLQAVAMFDGWAPPLLVFVLILSVDLVSLNLIEPWLIGMRTGASPTAILFAYVFWTWLWGGIGLLLAAPITVCLVALGRHVPALGSLHVLFGDEPVAPNAR